MWLHVLFLNVASKIAQFAHGYWVQLVSVDAQLEKVVLRVKSRLFRLGVVSILKYLKKLVH